MSPFSRAVRTACLAAALGAASLAVAEDTREACRADAIRLCPNEVAAKDRKAVRACIRDHLGDVSDRCRTAIADQVPPKKD
jgi:DNA-binding GntR family transcriptional regulator